jgi:hypothetical protein
LYKSIDFIVFKEGKNKTIEYALRNNIAIVNPLWMHDSLNEGKPLPKEGYVIKKTFTEIINEKDMSNTSSAGSGLGLRKGKRKNENTELKSEDFKNKKQKTIANSTKTEEGKKLINLNDFAKNEVKKNKALTQEVKKENNTSSQSTNDNINTEKPENNKENKKITNFFNKTDTKDTKMRKPANIDVNNRKSVIDPNAIHICSFGLNEAEKLKINDTCKKLKKYALNKIPFDSLEKLKEYTYIITTENYRKNDMKIIYAVLNNIKLLNFTFFEKALADEKYPEDLNTYLLKYPIDLSNLPEQRPLSVDKYKIHLHESLGGIKPIIIHLITLLGGDHSDIAENIRLSDICIIDKDDTGGKYSNVKLLNKDFLIDCFYFMKFMDMGNLKYQPERVINKKKIN